MSIRDELTLRLSTPADAPALGRLAQLDSTLYDGSPALIAQAAGELVAALPLDGGAGFADPFRRSAQAAMLLRLRRDQLVGEGAAQRGTGLSRARRAARRLRRYRAPASA